MQHTELTSTAAAHVPHETTGWTDGSVTGVGGAPDTFSTLNMHSKPTTSFSALRSLSNKSVFFSISSSDVKFHPHCRATTSFSE